MPPTSGSTRREPAGARPERTCVGCGRRLDPRVADRVARTRDGELAVGHRAGGRGAWLCGASPACFEAATRRGRLARALRVAVGDADVARLRATLYGTTKNHPGPR